jgi:hypothetical protein
MDAASLEKLLPTFEILIRDYGVEPAVAFYLWRPVLAERVRQYEVDFTIEMQKKKLLRGLAGNSPSSGQEDTKPPSPSIVDNDMSDISSPPKIDPTEQKEDLEGNPADSRTVEEYGPVP